jgi:hypothetical protein
VRLGDVDLPVPAAGLTGTAIRVVLPATVPAGVRSLQVLHPRLIGSPGVERSGAESNAEAVVVRPILTGSVTAVAGVRAGTAVVSAPVQPAVGRRQRVVLLLNEFQAPDGRPARAYQFVAPVPDDSAPATSGTVVVPVHGVVPGTYLVRVQVDGVQSLLGVGAAGGFATPTVAIP